MDILIAIIIFTPLLLYEYVVSPKICKKKIYHHISNLGGQIVDIEKLTIREKLYCIDYIKDGKPEKAIVRFDFFLEDEWKK